MTSGTLYLGTLYLIPATLGDLKTGDAGAADSQPGGTDLLAWSLPPQVRQVAAGLSCFGA